MNIELLKLAEEKGFKAKTVSTIWTIGGLLGRNKTNLITEVSKYLLLCEIQKWLREIHGIYIESYHDITLDYKDIQYYTNWGFTNNPRDFSKYGGFRTEGGYNENNDWKTYEEALEFGLQEGLKLIKNDI